MSRETPGEVVVQAVRRHLRLPSAPDQPHAGGGRRAAVAAKAKNKGSMPSQAPLKLMAWHLLISHGPSTMWQTATVVKGYPIR